MKDLLAADVYDIIGQYSPDDLNLRFHGNGFLQLDFKNGDTDWKLHVWHPNCIGQSVFTPIHNHHQSFHSTVLYGRLAQTVYEARTDWCGDHHAYIAKYTEGSKDSKLERIPVPRELEPVAYMELEEGSSYMFVASKNRVHKVEALSEMLITLARDVGEEKEYPVMVLAENGVEPDNEFNRYEHDEDAMLVFSFAMSALKEKK